MIKSSSYDYCTWFKTRYQKIRFSGFDKTYFITYNKIMNKNKTGKPTAG